MLEVECGELRAGLSASSVFVIRMGMPVARMMLQIILKFSLRSSVKLGVFRMKGRFLSTFKISLG